MVYARATMTMQKWTLDATSCNTLQELYEFLDVKTVDYSVPWPHGHKPSKLLINNTVAKEIRKHRKNSPFFIRMIRCEVVYE